VHTILADFQSFTNGGNGWLRVLEFSPAANLFRVKTYSPVLGQWDTDATSQFTLPLVLEPTADWELLGTATGVPSGGLASLSWPGRNPSTEYEWRVTVSDGRNTVTGPAWRFTTGAGVDAIPPVVALFVPDGGDTLTIGEIAHIAWNASDNVGVVGVNLLLSRTGTAGPYEVLATDLADDGSHDWTITAPATQEAFLRIVVRDGAGNAAADTSAAANWIRTGPTGIESELSTVLALLGAEPNPLRGSGWVAFALPVETRVRLSVVDVAGREVAILAEGVYPAGVHRADWSTGRVESIGAGIYFLRLATPGSVLVKKVTMLR
jgi:hypothetical protein